MTQRDDVLAALRRVMDPELATHSVVELGMITFVDVAGDDVCVGVRPTSAACPFAAEIIRRIEAAVGGLPGVRRVDVSWGGSEDE